jgi:ATP-dependent helicase/nuclease subunit B
VLSPPHVYTIPPDRPFLAALASGLLAIGEGDPLRLARMTAARSLREAFLRLTGEGAEPGAPLLLPRLRPIGALDADEIGFGAEDDPSLAIPPAIPELRRRLLLTRLVLGWSSARGEHPLLPGQAAALAAALARLLDQVATEGASFARLRELAPPELAAHWERVLDFLDILPRHWPAILAEEGALEPAERRNRLLRRQAELWRLNPPPGPVIAAGLTGGVPALTDLISAVAWMERGTVLLAGLDRGCSPEEWAEIGQDPAHPQYLLADLLRALEIAPQDVPDWPAAATKGGERGRRLNIVAQAMRPAALTDAWRDLPPEWPEAVAGISRYDCISPQDEAAAVALLLRRALEVPGETAALVTPDRELARRVAAELGRWGVDIDDSAGVPLALTPPGAFLRLVLDLTESALAPVPLLAALKHPLAAGGMAPEIFRDRARQLESKLRGPRPAPGFNGLKTALAGGKPVLRDFVSRLHYCLGQLADLVAADNVMLPEIVAAHIQAAERLAATDEESGPSRLWRDNAGEAAARFCHELLQAGADFPPAPGRHYPALFEALAGAMVVRPSYGRHPRLAMWGLVEARLQQADLVVLGGLNEGTWPGPAAYDPWMSRQMRQEFGIAVPERAIGIAAHDFAQALAAPRVALTRATRREGVPTVPSRWLLRLDAVLRAVGLEGALRPDPEIVAGAALQDQPEQYRPRPLAAPRPPLAARPRQLAVTAIETWIRDPYAIYARYILGLKALDELDEDPGRAELGIAVHAALAEFVRRFPRELPSTAEYDLQEIGRAAFGPILSRPGVWAFWWPRFERIARWFIGEEMVRRTALAESVSETEGRLVVPARGGPFTVTAKADRIDRLAEGGLVIIDYKTGSLPEKREIENAIAVQLPLEGLIARNGGFAAIAGRPVALEHWKLSTGEPPGKRHSLCEGDPTTLIDGAEARLRAMIERFDDPATPYLPVPVVQWAPRFSDYTHLERLDEAEAAL